jgi:hypothetical protein
MMFFDLSITGVAVETFVQIQLAALYGSVV